MNYRHAYHAGNFADVFKHAVLAIVVEYFKSKPAPFRVLDTHAGVGRYDLQAEQALKTAEWEAGIGRLLGVDATAIPAAPAAVLSPYLSVVRSENPLGELRYYPGSSLIARRLLRSDDRLVATELHPEDFAQLAARFSRDPQVRIIELDGWLALKACLPPKERRGIVLIDPPFEDRNEADNIVRGLESAFERFATGCYVIWYPIKNPADSRALHKGFAAISSRPTLAAEIYVRPVRDVKILNGCGLIIVNPPWVVPDALRIVMPFLADRMALEGGGGHRLDWINR